jgi:hypothetical protein
MISDTGQEGCWSAAIDIDSVSLLFLLLLAEAPKRATPAAIRTFGLAFASPLAFDKYYVGKPMFGF